MGIIRDTCSFFRSVYEGSRRLKPAERLEIYETFFEYMFYDKEPKLDDTKPTTEQAFLNTRQALDNSKARYDNAVEAGERGKEYGSLGGAPKGNQNARKHFDDSNNPKQPKTTPPVVSNNPKQPQEAEADIIAANDNSICNNRERGARTKQVLENLHERLCVEMCRSSCNTVYGESETPLDIFNTIQKIIEDGKGVVVAGESITYDQILTLIEVMTSTQFFTIVQRQYERKDGEWQKKKISNLKNYILSVLINDTKIKEERL